MLFSNVGTVRTWQLLEMTKCLLHNEMGMNLLETRGEILLFRPKMSPEILGSEVGLLEDDWTTRISVDSCTDGFITDYAVDEREYWKGVTRAVAWKGVFLFLALSLSLLPCCHGRSSFSPLSSPALELTNER